MKLIAKLFILCPIIFSLLLLLVISVMVEDTPLVQSVAEITAEELMHGKQVLKKNDPRRLPSNTVTKASLDQADLDLAMNYFANQYANGSSKLLIESSWAYVESTITLPANPFGRFLNIRLELSQAEKLPKISYLKLGGIKIPRSLADYLFTKSLAMSKWQVFADRIEHVEFRPQHLTVTYLWQNGSGLHTQLSEALITSAEQNRIEFYQQYLTELSQTSQNQPNLADILQPIFNQAQQRTGAEDSIAENRAAILVMAFYVVGIRLEKIIPAAKFWPTPIQHTVLLNNRDDFPKHYLISALLAAYAGTPLADAVGTFKEIEDSHGGSGFSFNDIAADRAGTRMGELAVSNAAHAKNIQKFLARAKEVDIMPVTADLPEFMPEPEFIRRFGGIHGQAYQQMMADIEHRIAELAINHY